MGAWYKAMRLFPDFLGGQNKYSSVEWTSAWWTES